MRKLYYLLPVLFVAALGLAYVKVLNSPQVYPIYYVDGEPRKIAKVLPAVYDEEQCAHSVYGLFDPAKLAVFFDCVTVPNGEQFNLQNLSKYKVERNGPG